MASASKLSLLTLAALCAASHASATTLPTATALGLNNGDLYAFVFVTSGTIAATSTSESTYNTFVSNAATTAGISTYGGNSLAWNAVTSVSGTTMNVNAPVASNVKVFLVNGTMVADGGTVSFYATCNPSGAACDTHLAAINITETGATLTGSDIVFTGGFDGRGNASGSGLMGSSTPTAGHANGKGGVNGDPNGWIRFGNTTGSTPNHLYGLSATLTAATATPEPASYGLIGAGLAALIALKNKRRQLQ